MVLLLYVVLLLYAVNSLPGPDFLQCPPVPERILVLLRVEERSPDPAAEGQRAEQPGLVGHALDELVQLDGRQLGMQGMVGGVTAAATAAPAARRVATVGAAAAAGSVKGSKPCLRCFFPKNDEMQACQHSDQ